MLFSKLGPKIGFFLKPSLSLKVEEVLPPECSELAAQAPATMNPL